MFDCLRPIGASMSKTSAAKTNGEAGFDSIASRIRPRHSKTNARDIPQPGQQCPVTRWIGQRSGTGLPAITSGLFARGRRIAADSPAVASKTPVAAAELRLSESLILDVAELVNDDHLPLFTTRGGDHSPNYPPE